MILNKIDVVESKKVEDPGSWHWDIFIHTETFTFKADFMKHLVGQSFRISTGRNPNIYQILYKRDPKLSP